MSTGNILIRIRLVLMLTAVLCLQSCTARHGPEILIGTWHGVRSDSAVYTMTFYVDNKIRLEITDQDGQTSIVDGKYETDFSKSPIPLSIREISQLTYPLHTLIEMKDADTFRMGTFAPRWRLRPLSFSPETEVWFSRQKEAE